jgi:hypothetical protein
MCEKVAKISIIFQNVKFAKSSHPAYRTNGGSKMLLYDKIMYFRLLVCLHEPWFSVLDATAASDTPQKIVGLARAGKLWAWAVNFGLGQALAFTK